MKNTRLLSKITQRHRQSACDLLAQRSSQSLSGRSRGYRLSQPETNCSQLLAARKEVTACRPPRFQLCTQIRCTDRLLTPTLLTDTELDLIATLIKLPDIGLSMHTNTSLFPASQSPLVRHGIRSPT